jgi:hypothetical protein
MYNTGVYVYTRAVHIDINIQEETRNGEKSNQKQSLENSRQREKKQ